MYLFVFLHTQLYHHVVVSEGAQYGATARCEEKKIVLASFHLHGISHEVHQN